MRACATLVLALAAGLYVIAGAAFAQPADVAIPVAVVEPSSLDKFMAALWGVAALVVSIVGVQLTIFIPALFRSWRERLDAGSRKDRVELVDKVMGDALAAGATPADAAAIAVQKIPDTVKASNKSEADLTREAVQLAVAAPPRSRTAE